MCYIIIQNITQCETSCVKRSFENHRITSLGQVSSIYGKLCELVLFFMSALKFYSSILKKHIILILTSIARYVFILLLKSNETPSFPNILMPRRCSEAHKRHLLWYNSYASILTISYTIPTIEKNLQITIQKRKTYG